MYIQLECNRGGYQKYISVSTDRKSHSAYWYVPSIVMFLLLTVNKVASTSPENEEFWNSPGKPLMVFVASVMLLIHPLL